MSAHEQGKFWEMAELLFENHRDLNETIIMAIAQKISLNMDLFKNNLQSLKYKDHIDRDIVQAISLGIRGTPTFFINGKKISGARPYEDFKSIIDNELGLHR